MEFFLSNMKIKLLLIYTIYLFTGVSYSQLITDTNYVIGFDKIEKIVDGDTFRLRKYQKSFRLMCIDTEETFKGKNAEEKTEEISKRWLEYYNQNKSNERFNKPAKIESPFGYKTYLWTKDFFLESDSIRIEVDNFDRIKDIYDRELVYIIVYKKGKEINYNIECVREGYSPYFNKYGNSQRFHDEFLIAQNEAAANKKGIWSKDEKCYPDYTQRIEWWNIRANQLVNYELKYSDNLSYINLMKDRDRDKLEANIGKDIIIFGNVTDFFIKKLPFTFRLGISSNMHLNILIYEENKDLLDKLDLKGIDYYYVYIKGELSKNNNNYLLKLRDEKNIWFE